MKKKPVKRIGILTAGGDSPGLNAAIRAVGKAAIGEYGWEIIGFRDGFRGLALNRWMRLDKGRLAGILTVGGTVLGTSRDKPHRMEIGGRMRDMTSAIAANYRRLGLDALVCIGGGGTHKNALRLVEKGLHIIGFDTALGIATEALDRLHSTAHSHHRIVIAEIMGHRAGWLALGAGIAGGADVILIPEIPYDVPKVVAAIRRRSRSGTNFSIVAVAEGAMSKPDAVAFLAAERRRKIATTELEREHVKAELAALETRHLGNTLRLAKQLEQLTHLEARVTILGYVQRGGTPSVADRLLATRLGTACAGLIAQGVFGVMVAARGGGVRAVPIGEVAGIIKTVPAKHQWIEAARRVGTSLGD
jgi:6-phosphofructokinase 1